MADNNRKKRILFLTKHFLPDLGGTEIYNKNILEFMKTKEGIEVDVITFQPGQTKKKMPRTTFEQNIKIIRLPLATSTYIKINYLFDLPLPSFLKNFIVYSQFLFANIFHFIFLAVAGFFYLAKHKINVIYTVGGAFAAVIGAGLSIIFQKRTILHIQGDFQWGGRNRVVRRTFVFFLKKARFILVYSREAKKDLQSLGLPDDRIIVIRNWVNPLVFKPLEQKECRMVLGLPEEKFVFLFATSLAKLKLIEPVLGMIKIVNESPKSKDFIFLFVGDGPFRNTVESYCQRYSNVFYYGPQENEKIPLYINSADIVWGICDVNYIALNTMEALSCNVPVISCDISSIKTIDNKVLPGTLPEEVGFLVSCDSRSLSQKLFWLNDHRSILQEKKKNCFSFLSKEYGIGNAEKIYHYLTTDL